MPYAICLTLFVGLCVCLNVCREQRSVYPLLFALCCLCMQQIHGGGGGRSLPALIYSPFNLHLAPRKVSHAQPSSCTERALITGKKQTKKKRCMVILFRALVTASATTCESERRWPSQNFTWNPKFCAKPVFVVLAVFVCLNSELGCKPGVRDRPFRTFPSWESFCLACYLRQGTPCPRGNARSLSRTWWNFNRGSLKPYQPLPCCSTGDLSTLYWALKFFSWLMNAEIMGCICILVLLAQKFGLV